MQWYYAINGQRQGPVIQTEFDRLAREGVIRSDTLVWRQGMPDWVPYSQVVPAVPPLSPGAGAAVVASVEGTAGDDTAICVVSGKRYLKREMIQYEGKWVSAEHRDAYFQRMREGVVEGELRFAGFWIRVVAKLIDTVAAYAICLVIAIPLSGWLIGKNFNIKGPEDVGRLLAFEGLIILIGVGIVLLYNWFFISRFQATPGKMALGLKIVRSDGSALGTGRIIGRLFAEMLSSMIFSVGYIMVAFDDEKRGLHDQICDTRVIKTR